MAFSAAKPGFCLPLPLVFKFQLIMLMPRILRMKFSFLGFAVLAFCLAACQGGSKKQEGDRLYSQGQYKEAIKVYTESLRLDPKNVVLLYNRGQAYLADSNSTKALADFKNVVDIDERNYNGYLALGKYFFEADSLLQSISYFNTAIKLQPDKFEGHYLLGRALYRNGNPGAALDQLDLAININNNEGDAFYLRGVVYLASGLVGKACADLKRAQEMGQTNAQVYIDKHCK